MVILEDSGFGTKKRAKANRPLLRPVNWCVTQQRAKARKRSRGPGKKLLISVLIPARKAFFVVTLFSVLPFRFWDLARPNTLHKCFVKSTNWLWIWATFSLFFFLYLRVHKKIKNVFIGTYYNNLIRKLIQGKINLSHFFKYNQFRRGEETYPSRTRVILFFFVYYPSLYSFYHNGTNIHKWEKFYYIILYWLLVS